MTAGSFATAINMGMKLDNMVKTDAQIIAQTSNEYIGLIEFLVIIKIPVPNFNAKKVPIK